MNKEVWMKVSRLIHAAGKFVSDNGPVFAVVSLYSGIIAMYVDLI